MIKRISRPEFMAMFDKSIHPALDALIDHPQTSAVVVFENLQMDSTRHGTRQALAVGPERTQKSIEACDGIPLGDLPSNFMYAIAAYDKAAETA